MEDDQKAGDEWANPTSLGFGVRKIGIEDGQRLTVERAFARRIHDIVSDSRSGYADMADFYRAALRHELERAERCVWYAGRSP